MSIALLVNVNNCMYEIVQCYDTVFLIRIAIPPYGLPRTMFVLSSIALIPKPSKSESISDNSVNSN